MWSFCSGVRNKTSDSPPTTSSSNDSIVIDYSHPSPNCNRRTKNISMLVLHYTVTDLNTTLKIFSDRSKSVSAHYLVPKEAVDGRRKVFGLVPDSKQAWHAGVSAWGKLASNLNGVSIGIEIVNAGWRSKTDWEPFTDYQMDTVVALCQQLVKKYKISPTNVVAHSDVALPYGRKQDPGAAFDWKRLYKNGVGAFYDRSELVTNKQAKIDIGQLQKDLRAYGYRSVNGTGVLDLATRRAVRAFQLHFRASNYSGEPDAETVAILKNLLKKYFGRA